MLQVYNADYMEVIDYRLLFKYFIQYSCYQAGYYDLVQWYSP